MLVYIFQHTLLFRGLQFLKNFGRLMYLMCDFVTRDFLRGGVGATTLNRRTGGTVDYIESGSSGFGSPARSLRSRQHSSRGYQNLQASPPSTFVSTGW